MSAIAIQRLIGVLCLAAIAGHEYVTHRHTPEIARYQARICEVAGQTPERIGPWIGTDIRVPTQALAVLKPNVMISRRFVNVETGVVAGLLLVHCSDAHHMIGHFPLRCYPAQGWQVRSATPRDWFAGDLKLTGTEYAFHADSLPDEPLSGEQHIIVANCLLRPNGQVLRNMEEMTKTIIGAGGSSSGAGQFQVYFDARVPQAQRDKAIEALLQGYRPVIDAILADPTTVK